MLFDAAQVVVGHEARMAHNGPDALHRANRFHPHVILCDHRLPEMDGYEGRPTHPARTRAWKGVIVGGRHGYGQDHRQSKRSKEAGFDQPLWFKTRSRSADLD